MPPLSRQAPLIGQTRGISVSRGAAARSGDEADLDAAELVTQLMLAIADSGRGSQEIEQPCKITHHLIYFCLQLHHSAYDG